MTQFCIEEATMVAYDAFANAEAEAEEKAQAKPGQITDPAVAHAMEQAKRLHAETFGVQV